MLSLNEYKILNLEIEQERDRIKQREDAYHRELEDIRQTNSKAIQEL